MSDQVVSMDKEYRTRDGREVRLYAMDAGGAYPVHGALPRDGGWALFSWTVNGKYIDKAGASGYDLIEHKSIVKVDCWMNVYKGGVVTEGQCSKSDADRTGCGDRIACIHIEREVEQGEGL